MENTADLILINTRVRRPGHPVASAIALRGGRVLGVGSTAELMGLAGRRTRRVALDGVVVPGLVDAHCHLVGLARTLAAADLRGASPAELVGRAVAHGAALPPAAWVEGSGWDQARWPGGALPTHHALSAALARPAVLWRVDGHAILVNAAALAVAGITSETPDPPDGRIVRDAVGDPTGVLIDGAMRPVLERLPPPGPRQLRTLVAQALKLVAEAGITGVHDMGLREPELAVLRQMDDAVELSCRVHAYIDGEQPDWRQAVAEPPWKGRRLTVGGVKLFQDGALGSWGAALDAPYCDDPACQGLTLHEPDDLLERVIFATEAGHQVAIHAIGDRAFGQVLDAFAQLPSARRPRVEHAQVASPALLSRAARLGAVLSMQPLHALDDAPFAERRLGRDRMAWAYAWGEAARVDCPVILGSDFPVSRLDPLSSLAVATGHHPGLLLRQSQALTPDQALWGATQGPAWATFASDAGVLQPGSAADLTILDVDPVAMPYATRAARVLATVVGGRMVWRHPEAPFKTL